MILFLKEDDKLILQYIPEFPRQENWVRKKIERDGYIKFKRTFFFEEADIFEYKEKEDDEINDFDEYEPTYFLFATLEGNYYKVKRNIIVKEFDIYIHNSISTKANFFVADSEVSIFNVIKRISTEDFYIDGNKSTAIPFEDFQRILEYFPKAYERRKYVEARISSVLRNYLDNVKDSERSYEEYLNKKLSKQGANLAKTFKEIELYKYHTIYDKLSMMLESEGQYNEHQWQEEILQIILLIYPKYILVFKEVPIFARISQGIQQKYLDFLLIDSNGNTDLIEIKKPFENAIMTKGVYRDNYIPLRELSGTVMQIEKYIYYLNRWSYEGEKYLTAKYKDDIPNGFDIKITNPSGIIIMGRENNMLTDQKRDFEVVKRKYKNIVDIITYDNLLERLKFTIDQIKKL